MLNVKNDQLPVLLKSNIICVDETRVVSSAKQEEAYKSLAGDNWKKIVHMGQMGGWGHNDRYFTIIGDVAAKITWGDFNEEKISYPMYFNVGSHGRNPEVLQVFGTIYIAPESFADYDMCKKHFVKAFDKSQLAWYEPEHDYLIEVYDVPFIVEHSRWKIEKGFLYERSHKSDEFELVQLKEKK